MGEANRVKKKFLISHPHCYICGSPSKEIDHIPPRILFYRKMAPKEYEFPVCLTCNHNTSQAEQAASLLVSSEIIEATDNEKTRNAKIKSGIQNNNKDLVNDLIPLYGQERQDAISQVFGSLNNEFTNEDTIAYKVGTIFEKTLSIFIFKMFHAIFYKIKGKPFTGRIFYVKKYAHLLSDAEQKLFDIVTPNKGIITQRLPINENKFTYSYGESPHKTNFVINLCFGGQYRFFCFGFTSDYEHSSDYNKEIFDKFTSDPYIELTFKDCINSER